MKADEIIDRGDGGNQGQVHTHEHQEPCHGPGPVWHPSSPPFLLLSFLTDQWASIFMECN